MGLAVVEIPQRDVHAHLHVRAATLAAPVAEMPAPAEEAREEVEGVVVPLAAALLVLLEALVAVLVVDAAGFGLGEGLVGFGDLDEFLVRGFVASVVQVENLVMARRCKDGGANRSRTGSCPGGISCLGSGRPF